MSQFLGNTSDGAPCEKEQIYRHRNDALNDAEKIDELCDDLADWLSSVTPENCDLAEGDHILSELHRLDPIKSSFDVQGSLHTFHEKYHTLFEKAEKASSTAAAASPRKSSHFRFTRRILHSVALIAVIFACLVTAQAFGLDIFGTFAKWTDQIFSFMNTPEPNYAVIQNYPLDDGEEAVFSAPQDAVDAFGITAPVVPQRIPEYLGEPMVTAVMRANGVRIRAEYHGTIDQHDYYLTIRYAEVTDDAKAFSYEKDSNNADMEYYGNIPHYIFLDQDIGKIAWTNGELECSIQGNIPLPEIADIINSIYEERDLP